MGAAFCFEKVGPASLSKQKVKDAVFEMREQAQYDFGHAGYTGTLAEIPGVRVSDTTFESEDDAYSYLDETCKKWEDAIAVRVLDGVDDRWVVGAVCSC